MAEMEEDENRMAPKSAESEKQPFSLKKELWEWVKAIIFAGVIVFLIFHFVIQIVSVDGFSMMPTLDDRDRLVVSDLFYTPKYGDIVILSEKTGLEEALVKRVIALPGQTVDIGGDGEVLVDGKALSEPYIAEPIDVGHRGEHDYPVTVPAGKLFVMGDNRNHSTDSRFSDVGFIDEKEVLGRVVFRLLPLKKIGLVR